MGMKTKQLPLALPTDPGSAFDNFVPGSNLDCLSYLQDRVSRLGQAASFAPTYIWGAHGSGKTHLLQSVADAAADNGHTCTWLTPEEPVAGLADINPHNAVILMDDCDAFDEEHQAAAFRTFIDAQAYGIWIVAAGACPPVDLNVREDLRTRLGWGDIFALKELSDEELNAALWQAFRSRGLTLHQDVLDYLLHHFDRNMASLMRLLSELDRYALASKRAITIPLIKSMLSDDEYAKNLTV